MATRPASVSDSTTSVGSTASVDVVIPTMGRWERVIMALDSISQQVGHKTRPIVVNDSGIAAPDFITNRCLVVSTGGRTGEGNARAVGLAAVESDWVAFCDDDDQWMPNKLRRQFTALANPGQGKTEGQWCFTAATRIDPDDNVLESWTLSKAVGLQRNDALYRRMLTHNPIPAGPSSILVNTEFLRGAGGWETELRYFADWECWIRLQAVAPPVLLDEELVLYRVWDGQMISNRQAAWEALDFIRGRHAAERSRLGVGPLDDRVIAWIFANEVRTPGRRVAAVVESVTRLRPTKLSHLKALGGYASELKAKVL